MKRLVAALVVAIITAFCGASPPKAQVKQSGNITPGHAVCWTTTGVIKDCGFVATGASTSTSIVNRAVVVGAANSALASVGPGTTGTFLAGVTSGNPAFRAFTGADCVNPTATTTGCIFALVVTSNSVLSGIGTDGVPTRATTTGTAGSAVVLATSPAITSAALTTPNIITSFAFAGTKLYDEAGSFRSLYHPDGSAPFLQWNATTAFIKSDATTFSSSNGVTTFASVEPALVRIYGSTSGNIVIRPAAVAGSSDIRFPAGTTDFSSTGGTSQVVKQTSAGGAFTVARLACADLSDSAGGCTASLGTGVATALAINVGTAGAFVVNGGVLGTPSSGTVTNLTGTASININGTVGATTPTTGAFTTVTASTAAGMTLSSNSTPTFTFGTSGNVVGTLLATGTSGIIDLFNSGGRMMIVRGAASAVNYLNIQGGAATGGSPSISAAGTDTNIALPFSSQGSGIIGWYTNAFGALQVQFTHTASADRSLTLTGSAGGNPTISTSAGNVALGASLTTTATDATSVSTGAIQNLGGMSVNKRVWMDGLTAASGTPSSICRNANEITVNAALTCTVSSLMFKHDFKVLDRLGLPLLMSMRPGSFFYNDNDRRQRWGFASEYMADVDQRLADGFDDAGRPRSIDQNAILAVAVKALQELKGETDELRHRMRGLEVR